MQVNFLKEIVEGVAGKQATEIVDLLIGKKDVNEFLIAKKLKLTINQTRNILYKLSEAGLVSSTRKKDKRKGWFIYFWTLDVVKSLELLEKKVSHQLENFNKQLANRKSKRFYVCHTCNIEVGEETALLNQFTCQECGQVYELSESDDLISELESKITKTKKKLTSILEEKEKEEEKISKKIRKKQAREESKRKKARKAAKRKTSKKKTTKKAKKETKKKPKKKTSKKKTTKKAKKETKKKPKKKTATKKKRTRKK
jgi:transcription factor E